MSETRRSERYRERARATGLGELASRGDAFGRFRCEVTTMQTVPTPEQPETLLATLPQVLLEPSAEVARREGLAPEIWVVGLIAIIVILLVLFGLVL